MIKNNFIAHGSDIFPKLLNALTQPGSEDDRPPGRADVSLFPCALHEHGDFFVPFPLTTVYSVCIL